jgi:hypothetical protein
MRIRVWNAFASNNSGSYTIVGTFPSDEAATAAAEELRAVITAHARWMEDPQRTPPSPFEAFVGKNGLTWTDGLAEYDDWPEHGRKNAPDAFPIGRQVVVHHDYTVTLPRTFGEFFYARGGRVELELNHAHHPLVAVFELWIPWRKKRDESVDVAAMISEVVERLNAEDGPLSTLTSGAFAPAWCPGDGFGEPDLRVGAVFEDLLAGFTAMDRMARETGFGVHVKVFEAWSGEGDPLAFLRPSRP